MFNIHSIKTKLVVVLAVIMGLLLLGQILFIAPIIKKDVLADAGAYQAQTAQQLADMLDISFEEAARELEDISRMPDVVSMDKERIQKTFKNIKSLSLFFDGFSVYNLNKENIYRSDIFSPGEKYDLPQGIWESRFAAGSKIYFSDFSNQDGNEPKAGSAELTSDSTLSEKFRVKRTAECDAELRCRFITPIYSQAGKPQGFLTGAYSTTHKKNIIARIANAKIGERGHAYIISAEGGIVFFPEKSQTDTNPGSIDKHFIADPDDFPRRDGIIEYICDNVTWIAASQPVKQAGLFIVAHKPKEDIV